MTFLLIGFCVCPTVLAAQEPPKNSPPAERAMRKECAAVGEELVQRVHDYTLTTAAGGGSHGAVITKMRQWVKDEKLADQVSDNCLVEIVRLAYARNVKEQEKRKAEDQRAEAARQNSEEDRRRREEEQRQEKISQACGGPEKVIAEYLAAPMPDERLKFCYLGSFKPTEFHQYYVTLSRLDKFRTFRSTKITSIDRLTYHVDAIADDGRAISHAYYLTFAVDRLLVDWPRSNGLNDLTIKAFQAKREQQPRSFWVEAELTEYYNFQFEDSASYQSANVREVTPDGVNQYSGYLLRSHPSCKAFIEYLSEGAQPMTVLLAPDRELNGQFLILAWSPGHIDREGIIQRR